MVGQDHAARLSRAASAVAEAGLDGLVVAPSADLLYLAGYDPPALPRLTALVVRPDADPALIVPTLERPLAQAAAGELAEVQAWGETDDPYRRVAGLLGDASRVACSDRMWATHLLRLQEGLPNATFTPAQPVLGPLRAVKDDRELELLRRAARAADETFRRVLSMRLETMTERQLASRLAELLIEMGHDEVEFTIVGSGPNGASPHHDPTDREIVAGEALVMDFGGRAGGYCSDITRTVAVRDASPELDRVHEVVREAQEAAFRTVRPGVPAATVDRAARDVIEEAGFGELFIHRTGHGIGLDVHEPPYIVEGNDERLRPGMCFSIEPGIYLPDSFGVRIEDIVTVTQEGAERLNHASRALETVA